jgi:hypothetical protein
VAAETGEGARVTAGACGRTTCPRMFHGIALSCSGQTVFRSLCRVCNKSNTAVQLYDLNIVIVKCSCMQGFCLGSFMGWPGRG